MAVKLRRGFEASIKKAAIVGVKEATKAVHEEVLDLIHNTAKSGRIYVRNGIAHQASAPGQPYASDTGYAVSRNDYVIEDGGLTGTIYGAAEYAGYLEFGTEKMQPRPVFGPALSNKSEEVETIIKSRVDSAIRSFRGSSK